MRIKSLEFENHTRLGTFKINLDHPVISIVGKNGSGKSFLISEMHPYGTSARGSSTYSVIKGESGYKKIVFVDEDVEYEIIHEYTPNKNDGHSAKSYINIIKNGIREELNPTGNGNQFKDEVKKYFNFDHKTMNSSHISFKTNGLTESSSKNRRDVLADIVQTRDIERMTKNCIVEHKTIMNLLQRLNDKRSNDSMGTTEQLKLSLDECNKNLTINNISLDQKKNELVKLVEDIEIKNKFGNDNKELINKAIVLLNQYNKNTINELDLYTKHIKNDIARLSNDIYKLNQEYEYKSNIISLQNIRLELIQNRDISSKTALEIVSKLDKYLIHKDTPNDYKHAINALESILKDINTIKGCIYINTATDLVDSLINMKSRYDILKSFIDEYNVKYINSEGGKVYNVDPCESRCELYRRFVESSEFVNTNRTKADEYDKELKEIQYDMDTLKILPSSDTWTNIVNLHKLIFTEQGIKILHMDNDVNNFIRHLTRGDYINTIKNMYEHMKDLINQYEYQVNNIKDYDNKIANYNSIITETIDKSILETLKADINNTNNELSKLNSIKLPNEFEISDIVNTKYYYITKAELINLQNTLANITDKTDNDIILLKSHIKSLEDNNKDIIYKIANLERTIEDRKEIENEYLKLDKEKTLFGRCRYILEKEIPLILLNNSLQFIEKQTNSILQENNIDIQISILVNGSDIEISAIVNNIEIPDISRLSSGELCLVSLIMNACVLNLTGYTILCLDEIDANLDIVNRKKFNQITMSLINTLDINQIICISHSIESQSMSAFRIAIGDIEELGLNLNKNGIRI